jgi:hypothetical protein
MEEEAGEEEVMGACVNERFIRFWIWRFGVACNSIRGHALLLLIPF